MCNCEIKTENIKIKAENEILRNELDEKELENYRLKKELQKTKNKILADVQITLISNK